MIDRVAGSRSVAFPAPALTHLRVALRKEAGPLGATHALHDAGFAAGEELFGRFLAQLDEEVTELPEDRFWSELSTFLEETGWGSLSHERVHSGLGVLRSKDWAECDPEGKESQPGCAFSAGLLAHLLGRVAEGPVAVLEVACRSRRDGACEFLFGSEAAIHEVYGLLLEGTSLPEVLSTL